MINYKKGDVIVALRNHSRGVFKTGDEFICDGFDVCGGCGSPSVFLQGMSRLCFSTCNKPIGCGYINEFVRESFMASSFIKKPSFSALIEYKAKVSIRETLPELVELKELQNQ